jgi:hypothetical protein
VESIRQGWCVETMKEYSDRYSVTVRGSVREDGEGGNYYPSEWQTILLEN